MISWTAGDCRTVMDRTAFRRKLGERALRLPIWFHVVVNLAAVLIPLYQWVTFTGLFAGGRNPKRARTASTTRSSSS